MKATDMKEKMKKESVEEAETFDFKDHRRFTEPQPNADAEDGTSSEGEGSGGAPRRPSIIDEFRLRAEEAEAKLQEYIEAFKTFRAEQEDVRVRLNRDVDRKVSSKFGGLVEDLLGSLDHLDLALQHAEGVPESAPLVEGVRLARDGFLQALTKHGIESIDPLGAEFDPNEAEALSMDPVTDPAANNSVTQVHRPGYRLGDTVIRPARVAVGRFSG